MELAKTRIKDIFANKPNGAINTHTLLPKIIVQYNSCFVKEIKGLGPLESPAVSLSCETAEKNCPQATRPGRSHSANRDCDGHWLRL